MATTKTNTKTIFIAIALQDGTIYQGETTEEAIEFSSMDGYTLNDIKMLEISYTVPKKTTAIKTQKITIK